MLGVCCTEGPCVGGRGVAAFWQKIKGTSRLTLNVAACLYKGLVRTVCVLLASPGIGFALCKNETNRKNI